jgi:hypothetical protein
MVLYGLSNPRSISLSAPRRPRSRLPAGDRRRADPGSPTQSARADPRTGLTAISAADRRDHTSTGRHAAGSAFYRALEEPLTIAVHRPWPGIAWPPGPGARQPQSHWRPPHPLPRRHGALSSDRARPVGHRKSGLAIRREQGASDGLLDPAVPMQRPPPGPKAVGSPGGSRRARYWAEASVG